MKEILFAQRLADNDKTVRDRTLKKLNKYLAVKSAQEAGITSEDALKLWKGLFYCMYMSDKPLIQEALAESISGLLHSIQNRKNKENFISAAFQTFAREWNGIDVFRINKFMMFVRRFLRQVFVCLREVGWDMNQVSSVVTILEMSVVMPEDDVNVIPLGLKLHLCSIILEELAKIGGEGLAHKVIMAILQPYLKVLALTRLNVYANRVKEDIIRHLMRQSSIGQTAEEEVEGVVAEGEKDDRVVEREKEGMVAEGKVEGMVAEGVNVEKEVPVDEELDGAVLDPRAGKVDACIPQLIPNFKLLADAMQTIGGVSRLRKVNRESIYHLVFELQDMAQGFYPLVDFPDGTLEEEEVGVDEEDLEMPDDQVEKAVLRLQKFEEKLKVGEKIEDSDDDSGVDLWPSKDAVFRQSKLTWKKKQKIKKQRQARKKETKGLTRAEKRKFDKKQAAQVAKRRIVVEHMLHCVRSAARISTISSTVERLENVIDEVSGFKVSPVIKKKLSKGNQLNSAGFTVVSKHGKKRKKPMEANGPQKKKKWSSFVVSDFFDGNAIPVGSLSSGQKTKEAGNILTGGMNSCKSETKQINRLAEGALHHDNKNILKPIKKLRVATKDENALSQPVTEATTLNNIKLNHPLVTDKPSKNTKTKVTNKIKKPNKVLGKIPVKTNKLRKMSEEKPVKTSTPNINTGNKLININTSEEIKDKSMKPNFLENNMKKTETMTRPNDKLVINFSNISKQNWFNDFPQKDKGWEEPLKEGEYEIFLKSRKQISKEKKRTKKVLKGISPKLNRSININLKQNKEHEYSDYMRTLRKSPNIPYSAELKPRAPAIKKRVAASVMAASSASPLLKVVKHKKMKKAGRKLL